MDDVEINVFEVNTEKAEIDSWYEHQVGRIWDRFDKNQDQYLLELSLEATSRKYSEKIIAWGERHDPMLKELFEEPVEAPL